MYRFFVDKRQIDTEGHRVEIIGDDVNHIKNVLRMRVGEEINVSDGETSLEYRCVIDELRDDAISCSLCFIKESDAELSSKIYLYQGLPKQDKMELVIQKAVELGVCSVIPVACHRSVVKLDAKKAALKVSRWNGIALAAAKQSKRGYIPEVSKVMSFKEAVNDAAKCAVKLLPYELADSASDSMEKTRKIFSNLKPGEDIAIFIGPEGGFEDKEVQYAFDNDIIPITLGRRILRTETAGMTVLSWIVLMLEGK